MPAALLSTIKAIGLSIGETVVLGVLLKDGELGASDIAKATRLKRTTTYGFLHELEKRGLVSRTNNKRAAHFQALPAEELPNVLARKREELQRREQELRAALPQILEMRKKEQRRIVQGEDARMLHQDMTRGTFEEINTIVPEPRMIVSGEKVAIYSGNGPEFALVIEDPEVARYFQELYSEAKRVMGQN